VEKFAFEIMASGKIEVDAGLLMKALAERPKQFIVIHVPNADKCNVMVDDDDKLTRTGLLAGMVGTRREALFVPNRANATSKSHVVADSEVLQPLGMMATIEDHLESVENFIKGIADKYAGLLEDLNAKTKDAYGVIKAEQEKEKDDDSYVEKLKESAEDADKDYDEKDNKQHSPLGNGGTSDTYTWTQTLSTLEVHVPVKPGVKAKQIVCDIGVGTLKVGIRGEPLILQGEMYGKVKPDDCMWTLLDNKILQISLEKLDSRKWWRHFMQGDLAHDVSDVADGIDTINDLVNDAINMGATIQCENEKREKQRIPVCRKALALIKPQKGKVDTARLCLLRGKRSWVRSTGARAFSSASWVTVGVPGLAVSIGSWYYEVKLAKFNDGPQIGWADASFRFLVGTPSDDGVGDDTGSWAVDGKRCCLWHNGRAGDWRSATSGQLISCAIVVDSCCQVQMWFAVDGIWDSDPVFRAATPDTYLYPAVSGEAEVEFHFNARNMVYDPPDPSSFRPIGECQAGASDFGSPVVIC